MLVLASRDAEEWKVSSLVPAVSSPTHQDPKKLLSGDILLLLSLFITNFPMFRYLSTLTVVCSLQDLLQPTQQHWSPGAHTDPWPFEGKWWSAYRVMHFF